MELLVQHILTRVFDLLFEIFQALGLRLEVVEQHLFFLLIFLLLSKCFIPDLFLFQIQAGNQLLGFILVDVVHVYLSIFEDPCPYGVEIEHPCKLWI